MHSKVDMGIHRHRQYGDLLSLLPFLENKNFNIQLDSIKARNFLAI
jgi:hypothetical protein